MTYDRARVTPRAGQVAPEALDADLGDVRLTHRLTLLMDGLADRAGQSFPKAFADAELEAA